jgi:polar amino acid transport system substrate-binding protein
MKSSAKLKKHSSFLIPIGVVIALALTACSSSTASTSEAVQRTITIATSNDAPFAYIDQTTGALKGIDGEMINTIAAAKGWRIKVFSTDFATLISGLMAKKADVIVDGMYITEKRKLQINFTNPWYAEGEAMIVPGDSALKSRADVKGKILGAQTGTVFKDFIGTLGGSQTRFFDSQAALLTAVENKQIDAAFTDSAVIAYSLVQKPNPKLKLVTPYTAFFPGTIGAGVRKEDTQLLLDLNAGLADLKNSSKYMEILSKYGMGQDNVVK